MMMMMMRARVCCSGSLGQNFLFPRGDSAVDSAARGGVQGDRVVSCSDDRTNVVGVRRVVEGRSLSTLELQFLSGEAIESRFPGVKV